MAIQIKKPTASVLQFVRAEVEKFAPRHEKLRLVLKEMGLSKDYLIDKGIRRDCERHIARIRHAAEQYWGRSEVTEAIKAVGYEYYDSVRRRCEQYEVLSNDNGSQGVRKKA